MIKVTRGYFPKHLRSGPSEKGAINCTRAEKIKTEIPEVKEDGDEAEKERRKEDRDRVKRQRERLLFCKTKGGMIMHMVLNKTFLEK